MVVGKPPFETNDVKTTYKKIKMNAYQFPEGITISDKVKNLINQILVLDPANRPSLKEILEHPFMVSADATIPLLMPQYTLACPLSKKFFFNLNSDYSKGSLRLESTAPLKKTFSSMGTARNGGNQKLSGKIEVPKVEDIENIEVLMMQPQYAHVVSYKDENDKFGIGYVLTNGSVGVMFSDTTKMLKECNGEYIII